MFGTSVGNYPALRPAALGPVLLGDGVAALRGVKPWYREETLGLGACVFAQNRAICHAANRRHV